MEAGATQDKATEALPETPTRDVGADGTVAGIIGADDADDADFPIALVAVTENV